MPAHLLLMPVGQVETGLCRKLAPSRAKTTPRRPVHHLDLGLGARGKDSCSNKRQLVQADPWLGRYLVVSPPGTKMVLLTPQFCLGGQRLGLSAS